MADVSGSSTWSDSGDADVQDGLIALPSRQLLTTPEAIVRREHIHTEEHAHLATIRNQIVAYVRQPDGSDDAKFQIAAVAAAMPAARNGLDQAIKMSIHEFFDKYPKIMSEDAGEHWNQ